MKTRLILLCALLAVVALAQNPVVRNPATASTSLGVYPLTTTQVAGSTGTTISLLATFDASAQMVVPATSAVGVLGVSMSTATVGQNVEVATRGIVDCLADNNTTIGHLLGVGTTTAGRCKDLGFADSTSVSLSLQIIGKARTAVSAGSAVSVQLYGPGHYGAQAAGGSSILCSANTGITHSTVGDRYIPVVGSLGSDTGTAANTDIKLPGTGTFTELSVNRPSAPGTTSTITYTLVINGSDTNLTCQITSASTSGCTATGSAAWTDNQPAHYKITVGSAAAAASAEGLCVR